MKVKTFPAETRRVVELLFEKFQSAGRGSMTRVARTLGLHRTFYSEKRHRDRVDVGALLATLRELGISPSAFFGELESGGAGRGGPEPLRERSTPETRRAVGLAYRRLRTELEGVDLIAELEGEAVDEQPPGAPAVGADWLSELDLRRRDQPQAVVAEIASGLGRVEASLLPAALGVWCSALRLLLELETAADLNRWALRLARAAGDPATAADLYVRRSYVVADAGDHVQALTLAERAAGIFARLGDDAGEGRALVDCGRWLQYLGRHRESIAARQRALELLPESLSGNRFGAFQGMGLAHLRLGEFDAAGRCAELAEPLVTCDHRRVKLLWLRASICRKRGRQSEAEVLLREVVGIFREIHPGEAALSACDLVAVVLEQGKPAEAARICRSLRPLLEPLRRNRIVDGAMGELLRAGANGSLSVDLVWRIKAAIAEQRSNVRTRREWRALAMPD